MNSQPHKILKDIRYNIEKYLLSEGFESSELKDYYRTSWTKDKDGVERIDVRVEISLEGSLKLANLLTEVIIKHCSNDCYFDVVEPGVLCCVVE